MKNPGFTLIELLIVISIIAVLTTIALISYQEFGKRSRDAKRQADLKLIQSALEDYHADQLYYPVSLGTSLTFTGASGTKTYLNTTPTDPKPPPNYFYELVPSGYCLYAQMEATTLTSDSACTTLPKAYGVTRP